MLSKTFVPKNFNNLNYSLQGKRSFKRNFSNDSHFFNRVREQDFLRERFNGRPRFTAILGEPNVGKSSLINTVLEKHKSVISIDLRAAGFEDWEGLYFTLREKFKSWSDALKDNIPAKVSIGLEADGLGQMKAEIFGKESSHPTLSDFATLLGTVETHLKPSWALFKKNQKSPIFFIDEANKLKDILDGKQGQKALRTLLDWLVLGSKQTEKFHVVFGTSDSFFLEQLSQWNIGNKVSPVVIGDLDREETKKFYFLQLEKIPKELREKAPPFDEVYSYFGGRMFLIQNFVSYFVETKGEGTLDKFEFTGMAENQLEDALDGIGTCDLPVKWNQKKLREVMKLLTKHDFVLEKDLRSKIGKDAVSSLVRHNLLFVRPTTEICFDISNQPNKAIVVPQSPLHRKAMIKILGEKSGSIKKV